MICPKCNSENVSVTLEQCSAKTKTNHTGIIRRFIRLCLIVCTLGLWLLVPKRKDNSKTKFKNKTICLCQNCGHKWYT